LEVALGRDFGDFQTPSALVSAVLDVLEPIGERWPRVLEPTCGRGQFLAGLIEGVSPPREVRGIELQNVHCIAARAVAGDTGPFGVDVEVTQADLFRIDLRRDVSWRGDGPLLVVGNPPWVTNSELGALGSGNHPRKTNLKRLRGIEARTGSSNFDIAEAIWLKLITELAAEEPTIALLCKTSVARNVLAFAETSELPIARASIHKVDARRWFGASVDACLFCVTVGPRGRGLRIPIFADLAARRPDHEVGFAGGRLVANLASYREFAFADGRCPLIWRQGLKHDASSVMELRCATDPERLINKAGDVIDIEAAEVYPLIKGSDLARGPAARPARAVIVTQHRIGQDTHRLAVEAPRVWAYLCSHEAAFARRKSSIYRGQPPFAMFGLGPYSFAPYKVAVSGLGKNPAFHAIGPVAGRPVMLDDTCYFLPCRTAEQAALATALLNDSMTLGLLRSLVFRDAKRPITKAILQRLDLAALSARVDHDALLLRAETVLESLEEDGRTNAAMLS
jgi:hypothetical protein